MAELASVHPPIRGSTSKDSPVDKLPAELLGEIMTMVTSHRAAPLDQIYAVCVVCKHWRDVALITPSVWASVEINARLRIPLDNILMRLDRSKNASLSLAIVDEFRRDTTSAEYVSSLLDILTPHFGRCEALAFTTGTGRVMKRVLEALRPLAAPLLRSLTLRLLPDESLAQYAGIPLLQGGAPLLQFMELERIQVQWTPFSPQTSRIKELWLTAQKDTCGPTARQLLSILASLPDLKSLTLRSTSPLYVDVGNDFPSLSQLEVLRIIQDNSGFMTKVIQSGHVSLANLRQLHVGCYEPQREANGRCVQLLTALNLHFSTRAHSRLRQVIFDHCHFEDRILSIFFAPHERLKEIVFRSTNVSSVFLEFLSQATGTGSGYPLITPSLTNLVFYFCPDIPSGSLLKVVKARNLKEKRSGQERMAALRSVKMAGCKQISQEEMQEIKPLLQV